MRHELVLERGQQRPCLVALAARADAQADVRRRQRQVPEEDVGEQRIVVLAGVHEALAHASARTAPG